MTARELLQRAREKYPFCGFEPDTAETYLGICEELRIQPTVDGFYNWAISNNLLSEIEL